MPNRVTKASTLWPGKYSAMLAKTLEDEARAEKSAHHEDAIECQSESSGSTQTGVKAHCLARMINLEAVMAASLYANPIEKRNWSIRHHADCTSLQILRTTGQVKPGPFKSLSKREEQMERCRKSESKVTKRLIKKGLARDIEILKSEVEDLKQMVIAQQPSLSERRKRKRVSFQDDVS
ncbi:hypothetical protein HAV15_011065 [Penicillium sp. str. |nr:hypothetical protein HAV15_011065 [Penicillium sp. str. \